MAPLPETERVGALPVSKKQPKAAPKPLAADQIRVDDKVYSAPELARIHPGGPLFVKAFAGRDATEAFLSYHRRGFPHAKYQDSKYNVYMGDSTKEKAANADADFLELCKIVDEVLPKHKSFAPFHYYVKIAFILAVAVGLEAYMHLTGTYTWYLSALLGWFMALIGLNIQHDANHGSISRNPWVNRILGLSQNWIGGSSLDWIHQHVVQHHIHTNDVHEDPDLSGNDYLRLNPLKPLLKVYAFQHIYLFILILFFGFSVIIESLLNLIKGFHYTPMSQLVKANRAFDTATSLFFIFRWVVLPLINKPSVYTLLSTVPMYVVGGYYLAFFFIISHNFVGVHMFDKTSGKKSESFLYNQVVSSSNVGGSFLCFMNGGLNYQIEHHLFPRMSHTHYPKIAPIVRAFCEKKKIPYFHFPTVASNVSSCVDHLFLMGTQKETADFEH